MSEVAAASISVEGTVAVPLGSLSLPVTYGPVELWESEGVVHFRATSSGDPHPYGPVVRRMRLAVEAAIAAASGASGRANPDLATYAVDGQPALHISRGPTYHLSVSAIEPTESQRRGSEAAEAVLLSADRRLAELWEVYLLGVQAVSSVAPVVGLWAFASVLEEDRPPKWRQLDHVSTLAEDLRSEGYSLPPMTGREPTRVRNAALHPTPKDPLPTHEEVVWLQLVAGAYLRRRAHQGRAVPSLLRGPQ